MFQHSFIFFSPKQKLPNSALKRKSTSFDSALNMMYAKIYGNQVMKFSADQKHFISKQRFEFLVFLKIFNFRKTSLK